MTTKKILYGNDAIKALASGADKLSRAVVSTLGPRSRNVAIGMMPPLVVHDGVTVARSIKLKDEFEDLGATLIREAATKTNDEAGDGTTTATLLANTLIKSGMELIGSTGEIILNRYNPMKLKENLNIAAEWVCKELDSMSSKANDLNTKKWVATVSSASSEIGDLVGEAIDKVGSDGLVMVEESGELKTVVEFRDGMEFENGYLSPYFVTDASRMVVDYSGGEHYVLITDYSIADPLLIVPIIEKVLKEGQNTKALLIISNDLVSPALQSMVATKLKLGAPICAVNAPDFGERRAQILEDIAVLTGGVVVSRERGMKLEDVSLSDLGRVSNIKITQSSTMITPYNPDKEEIEQRCETIREEIKNEPNTFKKEKLQYRLAKLQQGVAVIKVGGKSITEMREMRERVIDAVHATKAAISDGVVAGGGVALWNIANKINESGLDDQLCDLISDALRAPVYILLQNSGLDKDLSTKITLTEGIDMVTGNVVDMFKVGLIDPVKVTKMAIRNSFSVASMILTTETLIVDQPDDAQNIRVVNAL